MIEQPPPSRVDRRLLFAAAGLGGVLLGVLLLMTVFGGKGGPEDVRPAQPPPATSEAGVPDGPAAVPVASIPSEGRDPFRPVVAVPKGAGSAQGSPQVPSASAQPMPPSGGGPSTPGGGVGPSYASLVLTSISRDGAGAPRAQITVDGQSYSPAMGDTFSFGYRLERVDGNCVDVSAQTAQARMCLPAAAP